MIKIGEDAEPVALSQCPSSSIVQPAFLIRCKPDRSKRRMITGSLSSNVYGIARSTKDANLVAELNTGDLQRIMQRLGSEFSLETRAMLETLAGTTRRIIHVKDTEFKLKVFGLSQDHFDRSRFRRRVRQFLPAFDREVWVPTAEDVIVMKIRWSRSKDKDDVRDVIAVQADVLDWDYIFLGADEHNTRQSVEEVRDSIPPLDEM